MASGERPSPEEIVLYDKDPATKIATITFNRPDHLNAPTSAARLRYADLLRGATVDDDVKVVVIRGVGEDLGSGADLPDFMAGTDEDRMAELRVDDPNVTYPPQGSFRHGTADVDLGADDGPSAVSGDGVHRQAVHGRGDAGVQFPEQGGGTGRTRSRGPEVRFGVRP